MATDITKNPLVSTMINRVKNILITPDTEWAKIEGETAAIPDLFTKYALILAAIPALFTFLHFLFFAGSVTVGTLTIGISFGAKIGMALTSYVMSVIMVAVIALIAEFVAPHFGGKADRLQAFKLSTYSMTASWVAGVLSLISPFLAMLVGFYTYYLFYLGAQKLLKVGKDKAVIFTAIVAVIAVVLTGTVMTLAR